MFAMSTVRAVRAVVSGRVQGVGYRYATVDAALQLGVAGWVRNLPGGRVEVLAQGPVVAVDRLVAWLGSGPRLASVHDVDVTSAELDEGLTTFQIRY